MISVVMPTFNSEKYLHESIQSILNQDNSDWELLICDSNSTDDTLRIINKYKQKDKRIKIVSHNDIGVSDALNKGFLSSNGEILSWMNSDDIYSDTTVLSEVKKNLLHNDRSYLVGDFHNIDEKNNIIRSFISNIPSKKIDKFFNYNQIFTGSLFFKKKCFDEFGKFNLNYKFAFEYQILVFLLKNYQGLHINKFLSCFRIRPNQLSSNKIELKNELENILKNANLKFLNSKFLRLIDYYKHGSLLRFIKYSIINNLKINKF